MKILARRIAPLTHNVWKKSGNETVDGNNEARLPPFPHKLKVGMFGNDSATEQNSAREKLIRHGANIELGGGGDNKSVGVLLNCF